MSDQKPEELTDQKSGKKSKKLSAPKPGELKITLNYSNKKCDCKLATDYDKNGNKQHFLYIKSLSESEHSFAYASKNGLGMLNNKGEIITNRNITTDVINIDTKDPNHIKQFIDKYGFFTRLPEDKYIKCDCDDLAVLLERYQIMANIMSELEKEEIDYNKVASMVFTSLFQRQRKIIIRSPLVEDEIETCLHPFYRLWNNMQNEKNDNPIGNFYDFLEGKITSDNHSCCTTVMDSFTNKTENLDHDFFRYDGDGLDMGSGTFIGSNLSQYYYGKFCYYYSHPELTAKDSSSKKVVDFFYHLFRENIRMYRNENESVLTPKVEVTKNAVVRNNFEDCLISIAKQTCKEELDYQLRHIHPVCNMKTMSPEWEIPNLYTALYLSIYYAQQEKIIYRKCANEKCGRYYAIPATNHNQKYCCDSCRSATGQTNYRNKKNK